MIRRVVPLCLAGLLVAACSTDNPAASDDPAPDTPAAEAEQSADDSGDAAAGAEQSADDEPTTGDGSADETTDAEPATDESSDEAPSDEAPAGDDESAAPTADDPPSVAVPAELQFTAPLVGGGEIDMASLAGQPVLLWFWAPF